MFWTSTDEVSKLLIWFSCKEFVSSPSESSPLLRNCLYASCFVCCKGSSGSSAGVQIFLFLQTSFPVVWNEEQFTWCVSPNPLHTAIQDIVLILLSLLAVVSWAGGARLVCWSNINLLDLGVPERFPCSSCHKVFCFTRFFACSLNVVVT